MLFVLSVIIQTVTVILAILYGISIMESDTDGATTILTICIILAFIVCVLGAL